MKDARLHKTLTTFTLEVRRLLADDLVAVVLYGSAAGANFVPELSDLNLAVVVKTLHFDVLQRLQPHVAAWKRQGFALPLLLDQEFLQRARDTFPMEFYDIKEQHELLWGDDVFQGLEIDTRHLRFQAEHEARSKLLRLRALYLECADEAARLRTLLLDSSKTFVVIMRHLLRLHGQSGTLTYDEVLRRFERQFQLDLPRMHALTLIRAGRQPWSAERLADFFRDYLAEVQQIVSVLDHLPLTTSSAHD